MDINASGRRQIIPNLTIFGDGEKQIIFLYIFTLAAINKKSLKNVLQL